MKLPVSPPVAPMLAKPVKQIPDGPYSYEPKWDGFRSIIFRDGDEVEIGSRNERPMTRYFPELVDPGHRAVAGAVRDRRGDRRPRRRRRQARLRGAAAADPPGGEPGEAAGQPDPGPFRGVRPARARGHRLHRAAVQRAPGRAGGRPRSGARTRCTSPRPPPTGSWPGGGSPSSRAPGWTA